MSVPPDTAGPWGHHRLSGWRRAWLECLHRIPGCRLLWRPALWLRKPLKESLREPVDTEIWGLRLRLRPTGNLSEQRLLFMPRLVDREEREFIRQALHGPGRTLVDIGANAGLYTLWAASLRRNIRIEAFEPDAELCRRLAANLSRNRIDHVNLHQAALGDPAQSLGLVRGKANLGENRLEEGGLPVVVRPLLEMLEEGGIRRVDILKIDVEGRETDILAPFFRQAPASLRPGAIICEEPRSPRESPVSALIRDKGYVRIRRTRMNGIYVRDRRET